MWNEKKQTLFIYLKFLSATILVDALVENFNKTLLILL